jgi:Zn-dependent protease with chaperone function
VSGAPATQSVHSGGLTAIAVVAQAIWYAITAGPIAVMLAFGLLWLGVPLRWGAVGGFLAFLFFAWLATPKPALPEGVEIDATQAPALFDALERLRSRLDAAPIDRVLLTNEVNAAAHQSGLASLPWGLRQTLVLGIPLLAVLRPKEAEAVIAHELGHFSRRHGLWGHWIYRARLQWMQAAQLDEADDTVLDRAVAHYAQRFAPWFGRRAFAYSRQCEFEADHDAAQATSAPSLVQALQALIVSEQRMADWMQSPQQQVQQLRPEAPARAWSQRLADISQAPFSSTEVDVARSRVSDTHDTHPALQERARALAVPWMALADRLPGAADNAGAIWLGKEWPQWLGRIDKQWHAAHERGWRADSHHLTALQARLDATHSADVAQQLACLQGLERGESERALTLAKGVAADTAAPGTAFMACKARLASGDSTAATALEALLSKEPALALAVRQTLLAHAQALGQAEQAAKHQALCDRAQQRRAEAIQTTHQVVEQGGLQAPNWPVAAFDAFERQARSDACVQGLWMGEVDVATADGRKFHALVLVVLVDPVAMRADGDDEDDLRNRYARQLQRWREGPHQLAVARTLFTTEHALPDVLKGSHARAWRKA